MRQWIYFLKSNFGLKIVCNIIQLTYQRLASQIPEIHNIAGKQLVISQHMGRLGDMHESISYGFVFA
jgi:hypothetical protein